MFGSHENPGNQDATARAAVVHAESPVRQPDFHASTSRNSGMRGKAASAFGQPEFLIPTRWPILAPFLALGLALNYLWATVPPTKEQLVLGIAGCTLPLLSHIFIRLERKPEQHILLRYLAVVLVVGLPLLLYSMCVVSWAKLQGDPGWPGAVGLLAMSSGVSSVILSGRLPSMIISQTFVWLGLTYLHGSNQSHLILLLACIAGIIIAHRHKRHDQASKIAQGERENAQARAEELLAEYEQTGQSWFWETDRKGQIVYVSNKIEGLFGLKHGALLETPFQDIFIRDIENQESERTLAFHLSARSQFQDLAVRAAVPGDEERWWSISGRPIYDKFNNFMGFRGTGSDLTEKRRSEEHASRLAHFDSLTSLANRLQMSQTLEKILHARQEDHRACTVFMMDLDRFKQVNDTMGHPAGDALLKQVAKRLEQAVDKAGRVGRLGGDEFQVIVPGRNNPEALGRLAERIIESLSQPYLIDGQRVVIGASVGIAVSPKDGVTSEALIRNSDLALYAAKDGGRGRHHFYAPDLHSDAEERRQLEQDLRDAITHGGLELYYQPVVQTTTETISGFEALLRWTHPTLGPMSPAKFIPVAEDAGLIGAIGEWALRTACHQLAKWPEDVRVAVNVSPLQFANPALPALVTQALASANVTPSRLELEITESVFLNDNAQTEAMFAALKRVGIRLALDDFGTGYSSLGYLKKAPFDKIKIDQSFVSGATMAGSRNGAIIASIVSLAESLNMETTAEGVETMDELDLVRMLGCSHIQGYIYDKPLTADAASSRLSTGLSAIARGPRSARPTRQTMLRKVTLEHNTETYTGTIRNISKSGALIEGLWSVPVGTIFRMRLSDGQTVTATSRWCKEDRMGVEFASPLRVDETGRISLVSQRADQEGIALRRAS